MSEALPRLKTISPNCNLVTLVIDGKAVAYLFSYDTLVLIHATSGKIVLTPKWEFSKTTMKHVTDYMGRGDSAATIRKRIADGTITVVSEDDDTPKCATCDGGGCRDCQ